MKREDLLEDDEALDEALAALEGSRLPKGKRSRLTRTVLAAAGVAGLSSAMPAWAVGMLVVGGLTVGAGTTYVVHEAMVEGQLEAPPSDRKARGGARKVVSRPETGQTQEPETGRAQESGLATPAPAGEEAAGVAGLEADGPGSEAVVAALPKGELAVRPGPASPREVENGLARRAHGAFATPTIDPAVQAPDVPARAVGKVPTTPAPVAPAPALSLPTPPAGHPIAPVHGASTRAPDHITSSPGASSRAPAAYPSTPVAALPPSSRPGTAPPRAVPPMSVIVGAPGPERDPAPLPAPPGSAGDQAVALVPADVGASPDAADGSALEATASALPTPALLVRTLQLAVGADGGAGMTDWIPGGGPLVRGAWLRGPAPDRGLHGWAGARAHAGALARFDGDPARWEAGIDLTAGFSWQQSILRLDVGWNVGGRVITPSPEVRSPDDLANAGWVLLVTGPHLGARFGAPDRPGFLVQLDLGGTWLDLDTDPATGPQVHPRFALWTGVEIPFHKKKR